MARKIVFVVNPRSGAGATGRQWRSLASQLRRTVGDFGELFTSGPGEGTALARHALMRSADVVVAVGGDGTTNEIVNGFFDEDGQLVRPGASLAVLPRGTGSDFLRTFSSEVGAEAVARRLAYGEPRPLDVGRVRFLDSLGEERVRHFVNVASFGASGLIDTYVNQGSKVLGGRLSFALGSLRGLLEYSDRRCQVRFDDGEWEELDVTCLAVANGQYFGGGMRVAPEARVDDGLFDVTIWTGYGLGDFVIKGKKLYDGSHVDLAGTRTLRARKVEARCDETCLLDVDGEAPGQLPATFEILPGALSILA